MKKTIFLGILGLSTLSLAAVPPLSPHQRESSATHIVEGQVLNVESTTVKVKPSEKYQNRIFTAEIKVCRFVKSETAAEQDAKTIRVTYWRPAERPDGWSGSQGQNRVLWPEEKVRLYLVRDSQDAGLYHLLVPNGWDELNLYARNSAI